MQKKNNQEQSKYNAVWLSHSSVGDYLKCPRLYYLKNVWKNKNGRKVNTVSPHMSLGSAVHQVIEPLANLKVEERLEKINNPISNLIDTYNSVWKKFSGIMGGFENPEQEGEFKRRGEKMIKNVSENLGPIKNKTVKFYNGDFIPNIYLSEADNIILCGLVDWVEYVEKDDTLRVIDFKTGRNEEKEDSYQLPIYKILVESLQKRKVSGGAYWYLDKDKFPVNKELLDEDIEEVKNELLKIGLEIKKLKSPLPPLGKGGPAPNIEGNFVCIYAKSVDKKCFACKEFELIKNLDEGNLTEGETERVTYLGVGEYKQDLYFVKK